MHSLLMRGPDTGRGDGEKEAITPVAAAALELPVVKPDRLDSPLSARVRARVNRLIHFREEFLPPSFPPSLPLSLSGQHAISSFPPKGNVHNIRPKIQLPSAGWKPSNSLCHLSLSVTILQGLHGLL